MEGIVGTLLKQLSGDDLAKIGQKIGADKQQTGSALSKAVPFLVSALARNAKKPAEAESLNRALDKDHDGGILDHVQDFLGNPESANGSGILRHVLGRQQPRVTKGLAKQSGLKKNQMGALLKIAAPLVMGALGKEKRKQGLSTDALSSFLGGEKKLAQQADPGTMGILGSLLDRDKDGSVLDDVFSLLGGLFRKR